jgi:hypothetical protein
MPSDIQQDIISAASEDPKYVYFRSCTHKLYQHYRDARARARVCLCVSARN